MSIASKYFIKALLMIGITIIGFIAAKEITAADKNFQIMSFKNRVIIAFLIIPICMAGTYLALATYYARAEARERMGEYVKKEAPRIEREMQEDGSSNAFLQLFRILSDG